MGAFATLFQRSRDQSPISPNSALPEPCSDEKIRFLQLHACTHDAVETWQLVLGEMYCRAKTAAGHTATIHIEALAELLRDGLMEMVGDYGADLTAAGRESL